MSIDEQGRPMSDDAALEDLQVTDADDVVGAGKHAAPPQVQASHERDGYRASAGPAGVEVRRRGNQTEYEVRAGDRRVEGKVD